MARYVGTIPSTKPAEEVFDYMARFSNAAEWDPSVPMAHQIAGAKPGLGARYHLDFEMLRREIPLEYETTLYERPRRVIVRAENSTSVSLDEITVRERPGGGSEMTYDANVSLKGTLKLFDPVLSLIFRRLGDGAAEGLRRELNRSTPLADA